MAEDRTCPDEPGGARGLEQRENPGATFVRGAPSRSASSAVVTVTQAAVVAIAVSGPSIGLTRPKQCLPAVRRDAPLLLTGNRTGRARYVSMA